MNCCWWIILLFACRGNCGCSNSCSGIRRNRCGMNDCDMMYDSRSRYNDGNDDCDMCYDRNTYMNDRSDNCGCMQNDYDRNVSHERPGYYDDGNDSCDCNENSMTYETYGCQEKGVPCAPPVPNRYM